MAHCICFYHFIAYNYIYLYASLVATNEKKRLIEYQNNFIFNRNVRPFFSWITLAESARK